MTKFTYSNANYGPNGNITSYGGLGDVVKKAGGFNPSSLGGSGTGSPDPTNYFLSKNYLKSLFGDDKEGFFGLGDNIAGNGIFGLDSLMPNGMSWAGLGDAAKTVFSGLNTYGRFKQLGLERDKVDLQRQALNADILGQDNATLSANQAHEQRLADIAAVNQGIINDGGTPQAYTGTSAGNTFQYSDANRNQFAPLGAGVQPTVGQNPAFRNLV